MRYTQVKNEFINEVNYVQMNKVSSNMNGIDFI